MAQKFCLRDGQIKGVTYPLNIRADRHIYGHLTNFLVRACSDFTLEDIKEILRIEVRKSILHSHHVDLGTSKYDSMKKIESVETISSRETKIRKSLLTDLKGVESTVDEKLVLFP